MLGISEELVNESTRDRISEVPYQMRYKEVRTLFGTKYIEMLHYDPVTSKIPGTHVYNNMTVDEILEHVSRM